MRNFGLRTWAFGLPPPRRLPLSTYQPSTLDYFLWLLLPACASVLLLATTNKICQDVAVIPFLWVLPLALYLLSFIICFDSPRWYKRLPFGVALARGPGRRLLGAVPAEPGLDGFVVALFVCCMVCHGELYRLKPDPRHLTGYYLMIAAGGALGGLFVAVVAPLIFTDYFELHCGLLLCGVLFLVVCLRSLRAKTGSGFQGIVATDGSRRTSTQAAKPAPTAVGGYAFLSWLRWAGCGLWAIGVVALGVALWAQAHKNGETRVFRARNFYGVLTLFKHDKSDMRYYGADARPRRAWVAVPRPGALSVADGLLPRAERRGAGDERAAGRPPPDRPGRLGRRHPGRLWPGGRHPALLRDQPRRAAVGQRAVHLPRARPGTGGAGGRRARGRAAVAGTGAAAAFRPAGAGRLQQRRHPGASID